MSPFASLPCVSHSGRRCKLLHSSALLCAAESSVAYIASVCCGAGGCYLVNGGFVSSMSSSIVMISCDDQGTYLTLPS